MTITIYDVAAKAGVSTATVSKVLANAAHVSQVTRARVLAVVEELGYVPSLAARGLSKARTYIIGLAFPCISDTLFSDPHLMTVLRGIEQIVARHDYNILLIPAEEEDAGAARRLLRAQYVDGAITVGMSALGLVAEQLPQPTFPIVSVGYQSPLGNHNTVHADDRRGALQATRHLLRLGHRRIGVITAQPQITALAERLAGYHQALQEANVRSLPELVVSGDFSEASGRQAASELLSLRQRPTAIFALNDRMAIGAMRAIKQHGLKAPDDVAVVGFDDIAAAEMFEPPLTTVRQPALEMGRTATRMLFGLIEAKIDRFPEAILPALLVVRASCGAGAAGD